MQKHQYDIQVLRRRLKPPRPVPKHLIWGADLTYFTDESGQQLPVLGIVEHHSRCCLKLEVLRTKASMVLLRCLLDTIETWGHIKPKYLRTDNEAVFTSWLFRLGLWLLDQTPAHRGRLSLDEWEGRAVLWHTESPDERFDHYRE